MSKLKRIIKEIKRIIKEILLGFRVAEEIRHKSQWGKF